MTGTLRPISLSGDLERYLDPHQLQVRAVVRVMGGCDRWMHLWFPRVRTSILDRGYPMLSVVSGLISNATSAVGLMQAPGNAVLKGLPGGSSSRVKWTSGTNLFT